MINQFTLNQLQYIILYLIYLCERLTFKYINQKDIILNDVNIILYDKFHSLFILYIILNIQIYTITNKNNLRIIHIYHENKKISSLSIYNEKPINNINKIVLTLYYLDKYNIINLLEIYNCGVIKHSNNYFMHYYNYLGNKREEFNLLKLII
jgi:hypothetical protein